MKYSNQTLIEYCNNNNIQLTTDYTDENITRDSYIKGKCTINDCCNEFNKNFRQLVKTGAYCQTCMSAIAVNKIRESLVQYDSEVLIDFCNKNNISLLQDYSSQFVNRYTVIEGCCLTVNCCNQFRKPFRQLLKINGYCENCSKENGKIKIKKTNMQKYGVDYGMKNTEIKEKQKNTIIKKYGVQHISQLEEIKIKKQNTCFRHYGVTSHLKSPEIREQIKQTNIIKYGVENPQQNKEIKEKKEKTNLKIYGCKSSFGNELVKEKIIKTNIERYGVPHHSQNAEVAETMLKKSYNKKQYTFPSGKIVDCQGYERFALDELLFTENISEEDIEVDRRNVPEIWYNDKDNKTRRHYVDIYIKSQNRCIEVKSTWTNQEKNNVFEKQKAAKDLGLKYDIWIFDKNGNKIETY